MNKNRSNALDACRGVAVITVILYHLENFGIIPLPPGAFAAWPACGMFGVDLFYVLSGFFITQAILRPHSWQPGAFLRARVSRIYPAFLFSMLMVVLVKLLHGQTLGPALLVNVLLHLTMLHNLLPGVGDALNGVYWTLGVEFPYYLLMLALAPFLRSGKQLFWQISVGLLGLCLVWRAGTYLFIPPAENGIARFHAATQLPGALDAFVWGGMAAWLHLAPRYDKLLRASRWPLLAAGALGMALSLRYFMHHAGMYWVEQWTVVGWRSGFALACALVVLACSKMGDSRLLHYSSLPWFGKISFSLYLYHVLVLVLVKPYLAELTWPLGLLVVSGMTLAIGWASWRFIEIRFHPSNREQDAVRVTAPQTAALGA